MTTATATVAIAGDTLAVSGVLDFESAPVLDAAGRDWLRDAAPAQCNLDLSAVSYSSSVGVALLLGWLRLARQQRKTLHIRHMPADMLALVRVGGLEDLIAGV